MPSKGKYPDELRDRAARMVLDHQHAYGSKWEAICSVAEKPSRTSPFSSSVSTTPLTGERDVCRRGPGHATHTGFLTVPPRSAIVVAESDATRA